MGFGSTGPVKTGNGHREKRLGQLFSYLAGRAKVRTVSIDDKGRQKMDRKIRRFKRAYRRDHIRNQEPQSLARRVFQARERVKELRKERRRRS